jgi:hypothetical protein
MTVLCEVAPDLARDRFVQRVRDGLRHPIHGDSADPAEYEWCAVEPFSVGPVLHVDTSADVDIEPIVHWIESRGTE